MLCQCGGNISACSRPTESPQPSPLRRQSSPILCCREVNVQRPGDAASHFVSTSTQVAEINSYSAVDFAHAAGVPLFNRHAPQPSLLFQSIL